MPPLPPPLREVNLYNGSKVIVYFSQLIVTWCVCNTMNWLVQAKRASFTEMARKRVHQRSRMTVTSATLSGDRAAAWYAAAPVTSMMTWMTSAWARKCIHLNNAV